ncbi:hypothetical protein [Cellulomonas sp. RIT-PI-Y]|uniref:hypothetical protein n=1 Tax=Cellulomonas sp. RIT-PI-Y TaxID=3035297 RepID=UPI0021DB0548|nr:hypothetical protein [Cellulomonas sp. RIT-PI-Y]
MRLDGSDPSLIDDVRARAARDDPPRSYPYDLAAVGALGRAGLRAIGAIAAIDLVLIALIVWRRSLFVSIVGGLALLVGVVYLVLMVRLRAATLRQVDPHRPVVAVGPVALEAHGVGAVPWSSVVGVFVTDVTERELETTARTRGVAALGRRLTRSGSNGWVGIHLFFREHPVRSAPAVSSLPRWTPGGKDRKERPVEHWGTAVLQIDRIMAPEHQRDLARDLEARAHRHGVAWAELPEYGPVADWLQSNGLEALNPARMGAWIADEYVPPAPTVPFPTGVTVPSWAEVIAGRRERAGKPPL